MHAPQHFKKLANSLELNSISLLDLIGKINKVEPQLVVSNGDRYFLNRQLNWLDISLIKYHLSFQQLNNYSVYICDELNSTNDYILDNLTIFEDPTIIAVEYQSAGRGRNGKIWMSRIATDLTVSFIYRFALDFNYQVLPLVISVALNRLLKQYKTANKIKWPNDIWLLDQTKVAGILIESRVLNNKRNIVIGIGLDNLGQWERNLLLAYLIKHVDDLINEYSIFGFDLISREWLDNCIHYQQRIKLYQNNQLIDEGVHVGLSTSGELLIKNNKVISSYRNVDLSLSFG